MRVASITRHHHSIRVESRHEGLAMVLTVMLVIGGTFVGSLMLGTVLWPGAIGLGALLLAATLEPTYQRIDINQDTFTLTTGKRLGRKVRRVPLRAVRCFPIENDFLEQTAFVVFVLPNGERIAVPTKAPNQASALLEVVCQAARQPPRQLGSPEEVPEALRQLRDEVG